jgi:hypothetical protein
MVVFADLVVSRVDMVYARAKAVSAKTGYLKASLIAWSDYRYVLATTFSSSIVLSINLFPVPRLRLS